MAKEPIKSKVVKCIVRRGHGFHDQWRGYTEGQIVSVDKSKMEIGENLRELTAEELKMKPSELRAIEMGETEGPTEEAAVEEAV